LTGAEEVFGRMLQEGTDEERRLALQALDQIKNPKARRFALVALEDRSAKVREMAIHNLSWAGEEAAIPGIRKLLKDPDGMVRYTAVWALQNFRAFDALDEILQLQFDPDLNVRHGVIGLIGFWRDPRGKDAVLRALRNYDDGMREGAISSAASLRLTEALPLLMGVLAGDNVERADQAAQAIAEIGSGPVEPELLKMAKDPEARLRRQALLALSTAAPSAGALAAELRGAVDPERIVRQAAILALGKARGPDVLPAMRSALKDPATRDEVLKALAESPQPGAGRLAIEFLEDPDPEVVERALEVIGRQGVVEAIPTLEKLVTSPKKGIASGAVSALCRVAGPRAFPAMLRALDGASSETLQRIWSCFGSDPDDAVIDAAIQWIPRLEWGTRIEAVRVLTEYPSAKSTAFLVKMMDDPKEPFRLLVIDALARRGNAAAVKAAREQVRAETGPNRIAAAGLVVEFGEADDEMVRILVDGIKAGEERMVEGRVRPLVKRGRPEAKPLLLEGLRNKEWYTREDFAKGMARYPRGTFDVDLRKMAADADEASRRGAARGLTHVETPDRLDLLRKLLQDSSAAVRSEAVMAFWTVNPRGAPSELEARLADPSDEVRKWAVDVIGKLDPSIIKGRAATLLSDSSAGVREKAAGAVGRGRIPVTPALLEKLLDDPEGGVRSSAAWAIGQLGYAKSAEKVIRRWQNDENPWVRSNAAHALLEMGHERGLEAVRSLVDGGAPVLHGNAAITLMERADRSSVPHALAFVGRSSHTFYESNRTLLAMNVFTQPDLYRKAKETKVALRAWNGTEHEWLRKLGEALGLRVEIDPGIPDFTIAGRRGHDEDRPVLEELTSIGFYLNGAAIFEPGCLRVLRRFDALDRWERWQRETK
jgi:HEAT repeat protein